MQFLHIMVQSSQESDRQLPALVDILNIPGTQPDMTTAGPIGQSRQRRVSGSQPGCSTPQPHAPGPAAAGVAGRASGSGAATVSGTRARVVCFLFT